MRKEECNGINECYVRCKKVIDLLEQDALQFSRATEGEMLEAYRGIVKGEIQEMQQLLVLLKNINL